jgi:hypothetical protein
MFVSAIVLALAWATTSAFAAEAFNSGDEFVVAQQGAPLMRGTNTLATLSQGQRFKVLRTEGDWVGTSAELNGQTIYGWVHKQQVATPGQYAQRRTTRRYSVQPGTAAENYPAPTYSRRTAEPRFIMGHTPYGPSYWRADRKIAGY